MFFFIIIRELIVGIIDPTIARLITEIWKGIAIIGQLDGNLILAFLIVLVYGIITSWNTSRKIEAARGLQENAIKQSKQLYSEFKILKNAYEQENQTALKCFYGPYSGEKKTASYDAGGCIKSATQSQIEKIESIFGDLALNE